MDYQKDKPINSKMDQLLWILEYEIIHGRDSTMVKSPIKTFNMEKVETTPYEI